MFHTRARRFVVELPDHVTNYAWLPDGSLLTGIGQRIVRWTPGTNGWSDVVDLGSSASGGILRIVVNHAGDRVAIMARTG